MVKPGLKADKHEPLLAEAKQRAREQWSKDPCGAEGNRESEFGTRQFFDAIEQARYQEYAPWMRELMGFDQFAGARLLEVGCGMGTDLLQFARGGALCTGIDLTPRSIAITRHHFALYGERGDFLIADGERLPFTPGSLDVVYSNGVLHHTPDTAGAIRELYRVLKPGGVAKVMLYHKNSLNYWGEMMLHRGVLRGELLRGRSPEEIMSRWVEYSEHAGRPLVKVYDRKQARELFSDFSDIKIHIEQLVRSEFPLLGRFIPQRMLEVLRKSVGWNLIITARK
ncbi:MAG: methyltransferase domain-containing protein [Pyrinomonadaceae bacterium]